MDSDVSAEGDFDNESPRNPSRVSSNSDGRSSASPGSAGRNSDHDSSDEKSSPARRGSSSERESSPEAKNSDASEKESSPDRKNNRPSDRESSPEKNDSDRESSPDIEAGEESDRESSPDTHENTFRETSPRSRASSSDAKDTRSRESSPNVRNRQSGESSPDVRDSGSCESSSEAKNAKSTDSSPDVRNTRSRDSSPEVQNSRSRESSPDIRNAQSRESSPEVRDIRYRELSPDVKNNRCEESSPDVQNSRSRDSSLEIQNIRSRESSPDIKNNSYSDREMSPGKNHNGSPIDVSPENGMWPNSPPMKQSISPSDSPYHDVESSIKEDRLSPILSETTYENANGDMSPKSTKRSGSVCSTRSDIASSLDSVSPTQFERLESNKTDDEEIIKNKEQTAENKKAIIDFADDLSDVSDIESNDSFGVDEEKKEEAKEPEINEITNSEINDDKQLEDTVSLHVEGEEQLDFEAEEGECSPKAENRKLIKEKEEPKKEKEHSDLEEGELTDDNDTKPEETERPVCRFFSRGHCTWGSNCRFIHPGVMDKGNYSMFETVRPIVTPGGPPPNSSGPMMYPVFPPHMPHPHLAGERGAVIPPGSSIRKDEPPVESAWERGLRQAKEMIRKSSKRKETEVDFEDKKMNLTLSQDEIDKENDYYSRHSGSPIKSPDLAEKWKMEAEAKSHRAETYANDLPPPVPHAGADVPPLGYYPPMHHGISRPDYWNPHRISGLPPYEDYGLRGPHMPYGPEFYSAAAGRRYMHPNSYYPPRPGGVAAPPSHHPDFYDRKQKHKQYPGSSREVIVQKNDKPYKDESPTRYRNRREESPRVERTRDDEWADPWMRTKSPASGRRRRRKNTYSSGSSYSSSSESSRSSSRSSFSSRLNNSRSRSKVRSSGSRSHSSSRSASETQNRKKPMQFKLSPSSRTQLPTPKKNPKSVSPSLLSERRAATERAMHMNPPPPSPKIKGRLHSSPNPVTVGTVPTSSSPRSKGGLTDRLLAHSKAAVAAAMRSARSTESRSSKSSSDSSSSASSSDSSDSSASSSSSSKSSKTPPVRAPKRSIPEEHSAASQTVKPKAMDALKLSGQKQQIKLTLKGSGDSSQSKRTAAVVDNSDTRKDRQSVAGKKRLAESSSGSDSDRMSPAKKSAKVNQRKTPPTRTPTRDELIRQLRAVEDAIARKRSKNP